MAITCEEGHEICNHCGTCLTCTGELMFSLESQINLLKKENQELKETISKLTRKNNG